MRKYHNEQPRKEAIIGFSSEYGGPVLSLDVSASGIYVFQDCYLASSQCVDVQTDAGFPGSYDTTDNIGMVLLGFPTRQFLSKTIYYLNKKDEYSTEKPLVFLQAGHGVTEKVLYAHETLVVRGAKLVAWEESIAIKYHNGTQAVLPHLDIFALTVYGPGKIYLSNTSRHQYWQSSRDRNTPLDKHYNTPCLGALQIFTVFGFLGSLIVLLISSLKINLRASMLENERDL